MKKIIFTILINILFFSALTAQKYNGTSAAKIVRGCETVWVDARKGDIIFMEPAANQPVKENEHSSWVLRSLNLAKGFGLSLIRKETDKTGFIHYRYQFSFNQIPVENAVYYVHIRNGLVKSANGSYPVTSPQNTRATISQSSAYEIALKSFNVKSLNIKMQEKPLLTYTEINNVVHLAYKIDLMSLNSVRREYIYVNAVTGSILKVEDRIRFSDELGTAETKYHGIKPFTTDSYSSAFRLRETGRGGGIETYDLNQSTNYYDAVDFTNTTNYWNTTANQDNAAYDTHYSAEATYDYYYNRFGRNSFDNSGAKIISYVHYDYNYANAFWNGSFMTFGDGDLYQYTALTAMDIIAHEFTHGVTEYSAGLIYSAESGALNESFSDIFGVCVDYYKHPDEANFQMGEQVSLTSTPIRDCEYPNNTMDPDTYQGTYWDPYQEVHKNSTVQTYWFYLLTNGGSGTNDIGNNFSVTGIGMEAAEEIAYRNLSVYLVPSSDYAQAREYSIQAAADLFGACSDEVIACTNAWYAVGVGESFSNSVIADFTANSVYSCSVPATIGFVSTSKNASTYLWNFGDGTTSTVQNPNHTYTSAGSYSVSLIVTGSAACGGTSDTLLQSNYITITNTGGPPVPNCEPSTLYTYGSKGILNFSLNSINNSSLGASAGYEDFSCESSTNLKLAKSYNLSATMESYYSNHFKAWLDQNNDGQFAESEILTDTVLYEYSFSKVIRIPNSATTNTPIRLRIGSDDGMYSIQTSCTDSYYGQYEDYSVIVQPNTDPPEADFSSNVTTVPIGTTVNFTDKSQNIVTSWYWTFEGASAPHSTQQNPSVTYYSLGTYSVSLKVLNAFGQDSVTKTAYIQVVNSFNMCGGTTQTALPAGSLFDSGGPTGNYTNSENCSFLIDNCGTSITLSFSEFQTEGGCDYIRVYDGGDEYGLLLCSMAGWSIPPTVTAYSGKMFIKFTTDGSVTYSGFSAAWTSVVPNGDPPTGNFLISDNNPPINSDVEFTDASSEDATSWLWNFGDGYSSMDQNPTHSFGNSGNFQVTMIVKNCFNADTIIKSISIQPAPSIQSSPSSLAVNLEACGSGTSREISITNQSGGDLVYQFSSTGSTENLNILMLLNGVDAYGEGENTIEAINTYFTDYTLQQANLSNSSELDALLVGKQIVLIPEIETYPGSIYSDIGPKLQSFVSDGGSVIFCGSIDYSSYMFSTGLLSGYLAGSTYSSAITLTSDEHPVTEGIPNSFPAPNATGYYSISSPNTTSLAKIYSSDAVCVRTLGSGKIVLLGFDYYEYSDNSARIIANAVEWCGGGTGPSWLEVTPSTGKLSAGQNQKATVNFNSDMLTGGNYTYDLVLYSNDPLHLETTIPVTLTVSNKPCANFGYTADLCEGVVSFKDSSFNNPTSWNWNFGDGFTSAIQNPLHGYSSAGNYMVSLIVCNESNCDTAYLQAYLPTVGGITAADCNPSGTSYWPGLGIYKVDFNTISNETVEDYINYVDYSCSQHTIINPGYVYPIEVRGGNSYQENIYVWIDYNNDGSFSDGELVTHGNTISSIFKGNITIPVTATQYLPLRMRIGSDYMSGYSLTPCSSTSTGQFEDYTVIIRPENVPPVTNFSFTFLDNCQGIVQFINQTLNDATTFEWDFGDGGKSFQKNPIHIYSTQGNYTVTLQTSNEFGNSEKQSELVAAPIVSTMKLDGDFEKNKHVYFDTDAVATSYNWDFGDGQTSNLKSTVHDYLVSGAYTVTFSASTELCSVTNTRLIFIKEPNSIGELVAGNAIGVYPNPGTGLFYLKLDNTVKTNYELKVFNALGSLVLQEIVLKGTEPLTHEINLTQLPAGTYTVILRDETNKPVHARLIKL